jgi:hypothetical protein
LTRSFRCLGCDLGRDEWHPGNPGYASPPVPADIQPGDADKHPGQPEPETAALLMEP